MLKLYIMVFMLTAIILLLGVIYISTKHSIRGNKLNQSVVLLLGAAIVTTLSYTYAISVRDIIKAEHAYALYFASIDWLLLAFIFYARQYTKVWSGSYAAPMITTFVAILDNISLFTNFKWHHAFHLVETKTFTGEAFYNFVSNDYYLVHITFSYILVALVVIIFAEKTYATSGFHRNRYLSILVMFVGIILLNMAYLFLDFSIDISICFYAIASIFIGYYTLLYNPRSFVEYMLTTITERMECALVAFDENDNCIYTNQFANRMFDTRGNRKLLDERFRKWRDGRDTNSIANSSWNDVYKINDEDYRFDVHFNKIYDSKGHYSGCYMSFYDVTGDYVAFEEEKYRSSHDPLTGALNRESFYKEARRILDENNEVEYVMVCCNIKGFKLVNEMFGFEAADQVLIKVAELIQSKMKEGSAFSRLEGDRFAVLMPKERYSEELFMTNMNIISNILNNSQYRMVILTGVYDIYDRDISVAAMCDGAYVAIDSVRDSYKNTIAYYGDMLRNEYMSEQKIIAEFENALSSGQFAIFLQPVINMKGKCNFAEALVRWVHPERGIVPPASFVPLLEKTGYIYKLDQYVWEQAVKRLAFWSTKGRDDCSISVNISVKDFYYIDLFETLVSLVRKYNVDPDRLKLEITESVFMNEKERQIEIINSLRDFGFTIEIDDFGSGYSSLNMLKEVPANILKMDMAFISMGNNAEKGRKIVNTIVSLAKALDMQVIVEGVETEDQVEFLSGTKADYLQGFYFDRPLTIKQFEEKYL